MAGSPGPSGILQLIEPFEVSAVFAGAGIGTQTDSAKGIRLSDLGIAPNFLADLARRGQVRMEGLPELTAELRHVVVAKFMGEDVRS